MLRYLVPFLVLCFSVPSHAGTGEATVVFETQMIANPPTVIGMRHTLQRADGAFVAFKDTALTESPTFAGLSDGNYKVVSQRRTATALIAPIVESAVVVLDSRVAVQVPVSVTLKLTP
jgi:hypothetical protein